MQFSTQGIDLKQSNVAISISESDNLLDLGLSKECVDDLMVEITRHLLISKAKMVYGGDLRQMGFTELFKDLAFQYGAFEKSRNDEMYFTDFIAWPLHLIIKPETCDDYRHSRVKLTPVPALAFPNIDTSKFICPDSVYNQYIWAENLTKMRTEMERVSKCRIIAGGKLSCFKGKMAGILEEFTIARRMGHPVYIVGGYGGCAQLLSAVVEGKENVDVFIRIAFESASYKELFSYYESIGSPVDYAEVESYAKLDRLLDNGLSEEENRRLFHSVNIMEIVSLILKGINNMIN